MRQGNDIGSQYRSVIYTENESDYESAKSSLNIFQETLIKNGYGPITTEIAKLNNYYLAEEYHQQYLAKNPNGYCGIGGTGCTFQINNLYIIHITATLAQLARAVDL